ncbi:MAG: GHKL domain-containing protein [Tissierellia bacterium]|nr:GHKL domain-containing protein [Tissierellia bacterium]
MNLIETTIMSALDLVGILIISNKIVDGKLNLLNKRKITKCLLIILFLSLIMGLMGETYLSKYNYIYGAIVSITFIYLLHKKKIMETIYVYIICAIIIVIVQTLVLVIFLAVIDIEKALGFKGGLLAYSFILPILYLIYKYIPLNHLLEFIIKKNRVFTALMLNMFIVSISFLTYRYIAMEGYLRDVLIIASLAIGLLFVNLVIIKNGLRNAYEEKMLSTYEKYFPVINELMNELRSKQHDFDNHIQAINMITITSTDYNSIVNSMNNYIKDLETDSELKRLIKLDNKILAGFLYEKTKKAKENNIDFQIEIRDYELKTNLKDHELIEVIGNLIDNAFETGIENNKVVLSLKKEKNMSAIEIRNLHPYIDINTLSKFFNPGYSTKLKKGHGNGLSNIKKIINKNNGLISVQNKSISGSNYIVFEVLLN